MKDPEDRTLYSILIQSAVWKYSFSFNCSSSWFILYSGTKLVKYLDSAHIKKKKKIPKFWSQKWCFLQVSQLRLGTDWYQLSYLFCLFLIIDVRSGKSIWLIVLGKKYLSFCIRKQHQLWQSSLFCLGKTIVILRGVILCMGPFLLLILWAPIELIASFIGKFYFKKPAPLR